MNARARGDNDDGINIHTPLECQGPAWEGPAWEGPWKAGTTLYAAAPEPHPIPPAEQEVKLAVQLLEQAEEIADLQQRLNLLTAHTAAQEQKLRAEREARAWAEQQMKVLLNAAQSLNERSEGIDLSVPLPPWKDWREVDAEALLNVLAPSRVWARS